jgi:hypothetical protein
MFVGGIGRATARCARAATDPSKSGAALWLEALAPAVA